MGFACKKKCANVIECRGVASTENTGPSKRRNIVAPRATYVVSNRAPSVFNGGFDATRTHRWQTPNTPWHRRSIEVNKNLVVVGRTSSPIQCVEHNGADMLVVGVETKVILRCMRTISVREYIFRPSGPHRALSQLVWKMAYPSSWWLRSQQDLKEHITRTHSHIMDKGVN